MTPTPELIAEIDALYEKATKGPWLPCKEVDGIFAGKFTAIISDDSGLRIVTVGQTRHHDKSAAEINIALIASFFNHWPAIKQALSRERAEALEEAAKVCKGQKGFGGDAAWMDACDACAEEIRALKP